MPFLLLIFLTLFCLQNRWPDPIWQGVVSPDDSVLASILLTWSVVVFQVGWAWWLARRTRRSLETDPASREQALHFYERGRWRHLLGLFIGYVVVFCLLGWGGVLNQVWVWPRTEKMLPGAELLLLSPFLTALVLSWACFYDADRAAYLVTHKQGFLDPLARALLDQELPVRVSAAVEGPPILGGRWSYVLFKLRNNLVLVFVPLTLLLLQKELFRFFPDLISKWEAVLTVLGFAGGMAVLAFMPWIVRLVLGLAPLPDGPLRRKLLAAARRMRFRCSDILLWNTHGSMANAMVLGLLPWPRYVVFTERLLEEFTPEEVLAVFGHEVGHVKHHHMIYYLLFLSVSMGVLTLLLPPVPEWAGWVGSHHYLRDLPMLSLLLAYIFVVFGFLSRRCECQADIYGCRAVSCGRLDCQDHTSAEESPGDNGQPGRPTLTCPTGIGIFIRALEKVAILNGISRDRPGFLQSWQHSTIARRVAFLQRMQSDPTIERRFQRRVLLVKCGLFLVLGVVLVFLMGTRGVPGTWKSALQDNQAGQEIDR